EQLNRIARVGNVEAAVDVTVRGVVATGIGIVAQPGDDSATYARRALVKVGIAEDVAKIENTEPQADALRAGVEEHHRAAKIGKIRTGEIDGGKRRLLLRDSHAGDKPLGLRDQLAADFAAGKSRGVNVVVGAVFEEREFRAEVRHAADHRRDRVAVAQINSLATKAGNDRACDTRRTL